MSSEKTEIEYSLLVNTDLTYNEIRKLEIITFRLLGIVGRMTGGDPNLQAFVAQMQKVIMWIRHLQMVMKALEATTPIGQLYAIITAVSFAFTTGDMAADSIRTAS
jgi:cytochrome b